MVITLHARRRAAVLVGSALLITGLPFTLSACGSSEPAAKQQAGGPAAPSAEFSPSLSGALKAQVTAQDAAAQKAAAKEQARLKAERSDPGTADRKVCTTDPADRAACRNPSGKIDPNGGDVDSDGVYEQHEPVGPGYKDPRAYDGGKTSGETQCEWLRSRGIAC